MPSTPPSFYVDLSSAVSVYVQIENQVQFAIAAGLYQPGDMLPSIREMSEALDVNANTVVKSYRDLDLMGLVTSRRGRGVTISPEAPRICKDRVRSFVERHLREAVAECAMSGLTPQAILKVVNETIASGSHPYKPVA